MVCGEIEIDIQKIITGIIVMWVTSIKKIVKAHYLWILATYLLCLIQSWLPTCTFLSGIGTLPSVFINLVNTSWFYSHFADEESEAQSGSAFAVRWQNSQGAEGSMALVLYSCSLGVERGLESWLPSVSFCFLVTMRGAAPSAIFSCHGLPPFYSFKISGAYGTKLTKIIYPVSKLIHLRCLGTVMESQHMPLAAPLPPF